MSKNYQVYKKTKAERNEKIKQKIVLTYMYFLGYIPRDKNKKIIFLYVAYYKKKRKQQY